jgi:NADPH-dependent curcumin reductase
MVGGDILRTPEHTTTKTKLCLDEFGYDVAIDYKAARSIDEQLVDACPDGVDVYFD